MNRYIIGGYNGSSKTQTLEQESRPTTKIFIQLKALYDVNKIYTYYINRYLRVI
jgi:hypothetical protein